MDDKLKICITAETIHDMTKAYMVVCKSREDDISFHNKDNLQLELDGCFIKFMLPGSDDAYKHMFDQIIVAGYGKDRNNREWIENCLQGRILKENSIPEDKIFVKCSDDDGFWSRPQFPYI